MSVFVIYNFILFAFFNFASCFNPLFVMRSDDILIQKILSKFNCPKYFAYLSPTSHPMKLTL